jgi:hypothetical protein
MTLKEINKEINNCNKQYNTLIKQRYEICTHKHVIHDGWDMWHEWPDYGYNPDYYKCQDCGLVGYSNDKNLSKYQLLGKCYKTNKKWIKTRIY